MSTIVWFARDIAILMRGVLLVRCLRSDDRLAFFAVWLFCLLLRDLQLVLAQAEGYYRYATVWQDTLWLPMLAMGAAVIELAWLMATCHGRRVGNAAVAVWALALGFLVFCAAMWQPGFLADSPRRLLWLSGHYSAGCLALLFLCRGVFWERSTPFLRTHWLCFTWNLSTMLLSGWLCARLKEGSAARVGVILATEVIASIILLAWGSTAFRRSYKAETGSGRAGLRS